MVKVILSRKGFDEKSGGEASPIYKGKYISFPIPRAESDIFYKDLIFEDEYTYLKVMKDLGIKQYSEGHLDPDLIRNVIPNRNLNWKPAFGQSEIAQATLSRAGIGKGDLFLFFGWFKNIELVNDKFKYTDGRGPEKGFHSLYGYLEVDRVIDLRELSTEIPEGLRDHPHVYKRSQYPGNNCLYIATERLSFDNSKPGAGCFYFSSNLILTEMGLRKSNWLLPSFFKELKKDFNAKTIFGERITDKIRMTTIGKTQQEFFITSNNNAIDWAQKIVQQNKVYQ